MNRKTFVREYAKRTGTKIYASEEIIGNIEKVITDLIFSGETINLHGFMEIGIKKVRDRTGTDPRNSEPITIRGGNRLFVKPGSKLKSAAKKSSFNQR